MLDEFERVNPARPHSRPIIITKGVFCIEGVAAGLFNKRIHQVPAGSVYIGRPSPWGNPFIIGKDGTREEVIEKYREYLISNTELVERAKRELSGKNLVCFCAPNACHGEILLRLVNEEERVSTLARKEAEAAAREAIARDVIDAWRITVRE